MNLNLIDAMRQIEREKDIPLQVLIQTIEASLVSAYRKSYGAAGTIRVDIDWERSNFRVFSQKIVTEQPKNEHVEIGLDVARRIKPDIAIGDVVEIEVTPENFGRVAAQTAKQVLFQRIREAEREVVFEEFSGREGEIASGEVQRREWRNIFVNLGKVEALLPPSEQVPNETYRFGDRVKVYIVEVRRTTRTPQVIVSRSHPGLVKRLFELEVPEIREGVVELKSIAREPGYRTKIAVASQAPNVDPVGACVGHRGGRVSAIVDELGGEKIDIVRWSGKPEEYIASALSPATVASVQLSEDGQSATVLVEKDQQSLAIGKLGQNVRLAVRLTGWRIDIKNREEIDTEAVRQRVYEALSLPSSESTEDAGDTSPTEGIPLTSEEGLPTEEKDSAALPLEGQPQDESAEQEVPSTMVQAV